MCCCQFSLAGIKRWNSLGLFGIGRISRSDSAIDGRHGCRYRLFGRKEIPLGGPASAEM